MLKIKLSDNGRELGLSDPNQSHTLSLNENDLLCVSFSPLLVTDTNIKAHLLSHDLVATKNLIVDSIYIYICYMYRTSTYDIFKNYGNIIETFVKNILSDLTKKSRGLELNIKYKDHKLNIKVFNQGSLEPLETSTLDFGSGYLNIIKTGTSKCSHTTYLDSSRFKELGEYQAIKNNVIDQVALMLHHYYGVSLLQTILNHRVALEVFVDKEIMCNLLDKLTYLEPSKRQPE